jgi:two-component system, LytTR family, response regulator LytT
MNVLFIEDEKTTLDYLIQKVKLLMPDAQEIHSVDSVKSGIEFLKNAPRLDLIFSDIELSDGNAFQIFEEIEPVCPVIFITAYQHYAIKAFDINSIAYVLKPIDTLKLKQAIEKFRNRILDFRKENRGLLQLIEDFKLLNKSYKSNFLIKFRDQLLPMHVNDFSFFYVEKSQTWLICSNSKKYTMDYNLEELESQLNPQFFFRANRQTIISRKEIKEINFYFNNRLKVKMNQDSPEEILISKERVSLFKKWFES